MRDLFTRAAGYVDRIFKRARPGDLPVQQPAKFELISISEAKPIGLEIPQSLLVLAEEVIW